MCLQLSENADPEEIKAAGFDSYFVDHGTGVYPCSASGVPFNAACLASKGDPIMKTSLPNRKPEQLMNTL